MTKPRKPNPSVQAGAYINTNEGADEEYWWHGEPGERGASVIKTDRFGQAWVLDVKSTHWVTYRVAAGLLEVTVPTIHAWVGEGVITETKKRYQTAYKRTSDGGIDLKHPKRIGVSVIPLKEIERIAKERGLFTPRPLTPKQRRAIKAITFTRKKGGETNANKG